MGDEIEKATDPLPIGAAQPSIASRPSARDVVGPLLDYVLEVVRKDEEFGLYRGAHRRGVRLRQREPERAGNGDEQDDDGDRRPPIATAARRCGPVDPELVEKLRSIWHGMAP